MSILIGRETRLVVQGITGREGEFHSRQMLDYGTRIVAGVGIPQLTALYVSSGAAQKRRVTLLADGGINKSGDIVKALTLAQAVICGGILAGCPEAPGEVMERE